MAEWIRHGGGGGGGGHFHRRPYQMLEKRELGKRVSKSGVGAERADREKGVKIAKNPNRYDQSSSREIIHGKGM